MSPADQDWEMLGRHEDSANRPTAAEVRAAKSEQKAERPAPAPRPAPRPAPAAPSYTGWKLLVLVEMATLAGGRIVIGRQRGVSWVQLLASKEAFHAHLATIGLLAVLTTVADLGAGSVAATLGGAISISYLMATAGVLGPALLNVENELFGTGPAPAVVSNPSGGVQ